MKKQKIVYVHVKNRILSLSKEGITFDNPLVAQHYGGGSAETFLLREHDGREIWKLDGDKVVVRKEFVDAYQLLS